MALQGNQNRLRKGRYSQPNQVYHVIVTTFNRQPIFKPYIAGSCIAGALIAVEKEAETLCYCLMPDHLHWLVQLSDGVNLSRCVQKVKSIATKSVRQTAGKKSLSVWQKGFYDHALRREESLIDVARYIVANPLRAGLVRSIGDYPFWDSVWL